MLTEMQRKQIAVMLKSGEYTQREIGETFGCTQAAVSLINRGLLKIKVDVHHRRKRLSKKQKRGVNQLYKNNSAAQIALSLDVDISTVYRAIRELSENTDGDISTKENQSS